MSVSTATEWAAREDRSPLAEGARAHADAPVQPDLFDEDDREAPPLLSEESLGVPEIATIDARGAGHAGGVRFGELVHAMLAAAPLDARRPALEAIGALQGRILAAPPDEIAAAADTVERVLAHDLLTRARAAEAQGACRRETPVAITLADGSLVEGVVDLAFEDHSGWTIADYKTDREMAESGEDRYRRQIALYAAAVARATARPAAGVLIRI
jgi:ATP-dependent exoDNAse (exonuclease V) beta subunit